jgi:small subunit ribosomal protein S9
MATVYATGKRKSAIAKVWLTPGKGGIVSMGKVWMSGLEDMRP